MFHSLEEFFQTWAYENQSTQRIFAALTDEALAQRVTPEGRDIRTLAWHIVTSIPEMMTRTGLTITGPAADAPAPTTAADILAGYATSADSLEAAMREHWTDASLAETCDMYGQQWSNAKTLSVLIIHQVHHRAQLTVLMRQAGLPVPGIYGPSREEWAAMGMPAMP